MTVYPPYHPRKIVIHQNVLKPIEEDTEYWRKRNMETGGYVLGRIYTANKLCEITNYIDGGPSAKRTCASFNPDNVYAMERKNEMTKVDPELRLLGEYHEHPLEGPPDPSQGDFRQLKEVKTGNQRPWYFIMLWSGGEWAFFDLNEECSDWRQVPRQVVESPATTITQKDLFDRIRKIVKNDILAAKTALVIGCGSGGSVISKYLSACSIGRLIYVDAENLEVQNVIRHEGSLADVGIPKAHVCKEIVERRNPYIVAEAYQFDALEDVGKTEDLAIQSDLLLSTTGNANVNLMVNTISLEHNIPAVYGGCFAKASGGYVLVVMPTDKEDACFNCLFDLVSKSYYVDKSLTEDYDISIDELQAEQGHWIDISFVSLMASKVAVKILEGDTQFFNGKKLFLYTTPSFNTSRILDPFEMQCLKIRRRPDDPMCNFEAWARKQKKLIQNSRSDEEPEPETCSFFKRMFRRK